MNDPAKRERAALDVLALLPEWWAVGPTSCDPGTGRWTWTARGRHPGRGKTPESITGTGLDELAAVIDIRIRLEERRRPDQIAEKRGRAAFLEGAEERSRTVEGRPLTAYELGAGDEAVSRLMRSAASHLEHEASAPNGGDELLDGGSLFDDPFSP